MTDSGTRRFSLITGGDVAVKDRPGEQVRPEPGLADVLTLQRQTAATVSVEAERALFQDSLAEYVWARDVAGLSPRTLESLVQPVLEICAYYDVMP
ncbi:hypothetical protein [Streptomyces sp. AB3(2024)]|uniref:hypothetical protein n=1 Tax=Streptomyces sp. AB3(2024) TaxID=3317321 RepID=UPI0035A3049C